MVSDGSLSQDEIDALLARAFQKVIRLLDSQELAKALKSASEAVLDKVFRNMSKRAMIMFKEDMEYMGPIRMRDAIESQHKIVKVIRHLEDTGEIVIGKA